MSVTVIYVKKTLCVVLMSLWEQMVEMISLQRKKPSAKEETRKTTKQPALESCVLSQRGRVGGGGGGGGSSPILNADMCTIDKFIFSKNNILH